MTKNFPATDLRQTIQKIKDEIASLELPENQEKLRAIGVNPSQHLILLKQTVANLEGRLS